MLLEKPEPALKGVRIATTVRTKSNSTPLSNALFQRQTSAQQSGAAHVTTLPRIGTTTVSQHVNDALPRGITPVVNSILQGGHGLRHATEATAAAGSQAATAPAANGSANGTAAAPRTRSLQYGSLRAAPAPAKPASAGTRLPSLGSNSKPSSAQKNAPAPAPHQKPSLLCLHSALQPSSSLEQMLQSILGPSRGEQPPSRAEQLPSQPPPPVHPPAFVASAQQPQQRLDSPFAKSRPDVPPPMGLSANGHASTGPNRSILGFNSTSVFATRRLGSGDQSSSGTSGSSQAVPSLTGRAATVPSAGRQRPSNDQQTKSQPASAASTLGGVGLGDMLSLSTKSVAIHQRCSSASRPTKRRHDTPMQRALQASSKRHAEGSDVSSDQKHSNWDEVRKAKVTPDACTVPFLSAGPMHYPHNVCV